MNEGQRASRHDQATIRNTREATNGALDFGGVAHVNRAQFHGERRRHRLNGCKLTDPGRYCGIANNRSPRYAWGDLLEQFQPFAADAVFKLSKSGCISPGPRKAINKARADRSTTFTK